MMATANSRHRMQIRVALAAGCFDSAFQQRRDGITIYTYIHVKTQSFTARQLAAIQHSRKRRHCRIMVSNSRVYTTESQRNTHGKQAHQRQTALLWRLCSKPAQSPHQHVPDGKANWVPVRTRTYLLGFTPKGRAKEAAKADQKWAGLVRGFDGALASFNFNVSRFGGLRKESFWVN